MASTLEQRNTNGDNWHARGAVTGDLHSLHWDIGMNSLRFLDLPEDVRRLVYETLMEELAVRILPRIPSSKDRRTLNPSESPIDNAISDVLALMAVNREVRRELGPIFASNVPFNLAYDQGVWRTLRIGPPVRHVTRRLRLYMDANQWYAQLREEQASRSVLYHVDIAATPYLREMNLDVLYINFCNGSWNPHLAIQKACTPRTLGMGCFHKVLAHVFLKLWNCIRGHPATIYASVDDSVLIPWKPALETELLAVKLWRNDGHKNGSFISFDDQRDSFPEHEATHQDPSELAFKISRTALRSIYYLPEWLSCTQCDARLSISSTE